MYTALVQAWRRLYLTKLMEYMVQHDLQEVPKTTEFWAHCDKFEHFKHTLRLHCLRRCIDTSHASWHEPRVVAKQDQLRHELMTESNAIDARMAWSLGISFNEQSNNPFQHAIENVPLLMPNFHIKRSKPVDYHSFGLHATSVKPDIWLYQHLVAHMPLPASVMQLLQANKFHK